MSFGMDEAKVGKPKFEKGNKPRLQMSVGADGRPVRTPYECKVINARFRKDPQYGRCFFLDVEVAEDGKPTPRGVRVTVEHWPDTAKGGGKMTPVMARSLELGKVQRSFGAVMGFDEERAHSEMTNEVLGTLLVTEDGKVSKLNGRTVRVDCVPHFKTNADGSLHTGSFLECFPSQATLAQFSAPAAPAVVAPAAPAPVVPAAKPTLDQLLASKGLVRHPSAPNEWSYNPQTNETVAIVTLAGQYA